MAKLYDLARVVRSKNAGPFVVTLDLLFEDEDCWKKVSEALTRDHVAKAYNIDPDMVLNIISYKPALAIKVNIKRKLPSGHPGDRDVYGAQQHVPLAMIDLGVKCGED
jgi:hypothetical protein